MQPSIHCDRKSFVSGLVFEAKAKILALQPFHQSREEKTGLPSSFFNTHRNVGFCLFPLQLKPTLQWGTADLTVARAGSSYGRAFDFECQGQGFKWCSELVYHFFFLLKLICFPSCRCNDASNQSDKGQGYFIIFNRLCLLFAVSFLVIALLWLLFVRLRMD